MYQSLPQGTTDAVLRNLFPEPHKHLADPAGWVDANGGFLWSKQIEIAESVRDNRYTAVPSCHDAGKSRGAAEIGAWWLDVHEPGEAFVVTTAPTDRQVKAILWRELSRVRRRADVDGRITLDAQWYMPIGGEDELVAYGRKPQDLKNPEDAASAFQGIHARYVLVILDEAGGIPLWLWNGVDSIVTNEGARVLAIGNPDSAGTQFEKVCRPGSGWNVVRIDGYQTPNFTGEQVPEALAEGLLSKTWVEERCKRWGVNSAIFQSKVRGVFPKAADDLIISPALVSSARERDLSGDAIADPGHYGWDIARYGSDETVGYLNRAGMVRLIYSKHKQDTATTTDDIDHEIARHTDRASHIDHVGVGAGVYDRLRKRERRVHGFGAGERALDPRRFVNRRSEAWWALREAFEEGLVDLDPEDDELASQLQAPKWSRDARGRVVLESKDDMKKRGVESPDRADAVVMSFLRAVALVQEAEESDSSAPPPDVYGDEIHDVMDRDW